MDMARKKNSSDTPSRHVNRNAQQDKTGRGKVKDRHGSRTQAGTELVMSERAANNEDYKLDWFKPTEAQKEIIYSMCTDDCTLVSASSGCGKSSSAIWQGLKELRRGAYKKILFIKTPNVASDDDIGFLSGSGSEKLMLHFEASRGIFRQFMSPAKLEMEEKREHIVFAIPNFIQGATYDDTLIIIDEVQNISPPILKLIMERAGRGSKIVVLADKKQRYSHRKRDDGFSFFVDIVTEVDEEGRYSKVDSIGYIEIPASENMRSDLSRLVVTLFEDAM